MFSARRSNLINGLKAFFGRRPKNGIRMPASCAAIKRWPIADTPQQGLVLAGLDASKLTGSARKFCMECGAIGVIATDAGFGKVPNEDVVVVVPHNNFAAALDGVGGYWGGDRAARFLGQGFVEFPEDIEKAIDHAQHKIRSLDYEESLRLFGSSACFFSARIRRQQDRLVADLAQAGDCRMVLLRANGEVWESQDQSYVGEMLAKGLMDEDEALYHDARNRVTNAIRMAFSNDVLTSPCLVLAGNQAQMLGPIALEGGDRIILTSDGISDNLTGSEVQRLIQDKDPWQALNVIAEVTWKRMTTAEAMRDQMIREYLSETEHITDEQTMDRVMDKIQDPLSPYQWLFHVAFHRARRKKGSFPDGFRCKPAQDNRAIVILDIPR